MVIFEETMDILEITKNWLIENKRDGLYSLEMSCACLLDDLIPCGDPCPDCTVGFKVPCPRKKEADNPDIDCDCDLNDPEAWHMQEGKEK